MMLRTEGADLYYRVQGDGPPLLLAQSGEGDADRSVDLVARLVQHYTVISYDRRGLSRSRPDDPERPVTVAEHADDARRLIDAVADGPAVVVGCSFGAMIGLRLIADHPASVRLLVAHEPSSLGLLPTPERSAVTDSIRNLQQVHRRDGWRAVIPLLQQLLGIDPATQDREPGLTPQPVLTEQRAANFDRFLSTDCDTLLSDTLTAADIARSGPRIVPAAGRSTDPAVFDHRCAVLLSAALGVPVADFPGGHNGNLTHPAAFAARLHEVITDTLAATAQRA